MSKPTDTHKKASRRARRSIMDERIAFSYQMHDVGDISTERLFQMVADDCKVDVTRIIAALKRTGLLKPVEGVTQP